MTKTSIATIPAEMYENDALIGSFEGAIKKVAVVNINIKKSLKSKWKRFIEFNTNFIQICNLLCFGDNAVG